MAQKKSKHRWTEEEWLYCLYVAKYVEENQWIDFIGRHRIDVRIYGRKGDPAKVRMGCQNFQYLLTGGKKGLGNVSELQKEAFKKYGNWSEPQLRKRVFGEHREPIDF